MRPLIYFNSKNNANERIALINILQRKKSTNIRGL